MIYVWNFKFVWRLERCDRLHNINALPKVAYSTFEFYSTVPNNFCLNMSNR